MEEGGLGEETAMTNSKVLGRETRTGSRGSLEVNRKFEEAGCGGGE